MKYVAISLMVALLFTSFKFPKSIFVPKQHPNPPQGFVTVDGTQFKIDGKPYHFVGTNFWYGMHLGVPKHRDRLIKELDQLQALGCNNLRIMVGSEGPEGEKYRVQPPLLQKPFEYNEEILEGLDFLLAEMEKRNLYAVMVLGNFWHWSGGFAQYLSWLDDKPIPYPDLEGGPSWGIYMDYTFRFYTNNRARNWFKAHVKKIVERTNTITGQTYKDNPTIMAWQLANEPKCGVRVGPYRNWIRHTAKFIRKMDPNHLISTGSEGIMSESLFGNRRKNFVKNHSMGIDYLTAHIWIQNWGWYDPMKVATLETAQKKAIAYLDKHIEIAKALNMPVVLEEFGIARDAESYDATSTVEQRDAYYKHMFDYLAQNIEKKSPFQGINFWAWGGAGRPRVPRSVYKAGDDLIGDPPHEYQGWYSVYNTDKTTHALILDFNQRYNSFMNKEG